MPFGNVAENIKVRRVLGVASRMNSKSSRKPISSISSASSSTTTSRADRSSPPRSKWSRKRPGVPTTICTPSSRRRRSRRASMPPTHVAIRAPACSKSQANSRSTCKANSRVGAMTSACGAPARPNFWLSPRISPAMAKPKATVLPEPV